MFRTDLLISFLSFFIILSGIDQAAGQYIDLKTAESILDEYDSVCRKDGGQLWGINLYGPVMFAHKESRTIVTNHQDQNGTLTKKGELYTGILPDKTGIANTTQYWNGIQWTMVMWPLPRDKAKRLTLIFHEAFHSIQKQLGVDRATREARHLDAREGRIWQQLEWLALEKALYTSDLMRKDHIRNALIFREYRRGIFAGADSIENDLEIMEGIPEYTGIKLSGRNRKEIRNLLSKKIADAMDGPNFFRTFPYVTGPLYAIMLDESGYNWKSKLYDTSDLGEIIHIAYKTELPESGSGELQNEAHQKMNNYKGEKILRAEKRREARSQKEKQALIKKLVTGPVLTLPLKNPNLTFNPGNMQPLEDYGTYYGTIRISDQWGIIEVENGALIDKDWKELRVSAARLKMRDKIEGNGWSLELVKGWVISPGDRSKDYKIISLDTK